MSVEVVFWAVVGARFALPLLIPLVPLPAIIGCLLLDGVDQTIFQAFGYDPPYYQSYDKAMDVFYLSVAFLASLRNWTSQAAVQVNRFLFFFRLVGVVTFELSGARIVLLLFPNTFEFFFIAYEAIRTRWNPARFGLRFWVVTAGLIWVVVKLPQEYWIHVAQLDLTDSIRDVSWFGPALVVALAAVTALAYFVVRPRLRPAEWAEWRYRADPLPTEMDEAHERAAHHARHRKVLDLAAVEKVFLIGLISVIFGRLLPGVQTSDLRLFAAIAAFVVVNSAIGLWSARRGYSWDSVAVSFAIVFLTNVVLVVVAELLLVRGGGDLQLVDALFFVLLFSVLSMLYDRFHPVNEYRARQPVPLP